MRYRVLQILCLIVGVVFGISLFAPVGDRSDSGYRVGVLLGKLIMVMLTIGCFVAAVRFGRAARKGQATVAKP